MALTTPIYSSYFNNTLATKQITFTDSTDFVAQGTVAGNVTVVVKIVDPLGTTTYNNTNHAAPDIDCGTSLDSIITIPLTLDGNKEILQGDWEITLEYVDSVVAATIVDVKTFTLTYTSPEIDIAIIADCISPLLSATDKTKYTRNYVVPTVVRDFVLNYPTSLAITPLSGTGSMITSSTLYTSSTEALEYSATLTSTLTYLFDSTNLIYFIDEVDGSEVAWITCAADLCDIYCCIKSQYNRWKSAINVNAVLATQELAKFNAVMSITSMVGLALRCSMSTDISGYVTEILDLAGCEAGCSCGDGTPQLVTGLGVAGDEVIVEEGTGITVTSTSGGGTTTYVVGLTTLNVSKLANLFNTIPVAGTGVTVSAPTVTTVGSVTTKSYTITATDTIVESLFARVHLAFAAGVVPVLTIEDQKKYGSAFATIDMVALNEFITNNNNNNSLSTAWLTSFTSFTIDNFFTTPADYYPSVEIVNIVRPVPGNKSSWLSNSNVEITSMSASSFDIRFVDGSGTPVTGTSLQEFTSLELIFKINA